jgi:uncharacterized protein YecE (DUF72 family)
MLDAYADVFDALEINATYYRTPPVATAQRMVDIAAGRLRFAIKVPGALTHERKLDAATLDPYLAFLAPFRESATLEALLLQFPNAFHFSEPCIQFLAHAADLLWPHPLVIEMRHQSWDTGTADSEIASLGYSRCAVDQPPLKGLSQSQRWSMTGPIAYLRLHGRNAAQWYDEQNPRDRYRYTYSDAELDEWVAPIQQAREKATSTLVFFNNHPDGGAAWNAETMAAKLGVPLRGSGYRDLFG